MIRKASFLRLCALLAGLALAGCSSASEILPAVHPDGGATLVFDKPYEIVFPAAVRVMADNGERLREARPETGRIISFGTLRTPRAVFLTRLAHGRTRVEISSNFTGGLVRAFPGGPEGFFAALREQIVVYEKKAVIEAEKKRLELLRRHARPQNQAGPSPGASPGY